MLSSHARQGSCAGRRVDGIKLALGAIAAWSFFPATCVLSSAPAAASRESPEGRRRPSGPRIGLGAVAGARAVALKQIHSSK